jgi:hypothetical protein
MDLTFATKARTKGGGDGAHYCGSSEVVGKGQAADDIHFRA